MVMLQLLQVCAHFLAGFTYSTPHLLLRLQQLLSSATGGRMGGGLEVAILLTNAGKGAAVKNSPLEGKPQQGRSSRPTAEQRHFQEYAYGDS